MKKTNFSWTLPGGVFAGIAASLCCLGPPSNNPTMSDCCSVSPTAEATPAPAAARLACPRCGQPGKDVSLLTLKHQVKLAHLETVEAGPFAFCRSSECLVVYFNATGTTLF